MSKKRKVLFAHDTHLLRTPDNDFYNEHISNRIKDRYLFLGDKVTFLTRWRNVKESDVAGRLNKIDKENVSFREVPNFKSIKLYLKNKKRAQKIVDQVVSEHDILVARLSSAIGVMAVQAARKHKVPYLVEFVSCPFDAYWNYSFFGKMIAYYKLWRQKQVMKDVPYVVYVTEKFLQRRYPAGGKSIHCSNVELPELEEGILLERLEKIKETDLKNLTFCTVAAIDVLYKGQADVIKAIGILKEKNIHVNYKIIGRGDPARLKQIAEKHRVEDQIQIMGLVKHDRVFELLKKVDVYIQPSKAEGLPRALIEAMSLGCPALGGRAGGIPELISEENVFKPGAVDEIVQHVLKIDKQWLLDQSKKNYEEALKYRRSVLEERRKMFFKEFLKDQFNEL